MKKRYIFIIIACLIINTNFIFAQENVKIQNNQFKLDKKGTQKALKDVRYGDHYYQENTEGSYYKALNYYLSAYDYNSGNAELNYKIGICYLESVHKNRALSYLQSAFEAKKDVSTDILYNLGRAYHYNYMFEEAIKYYSEFKKILSSKQEEKYGTIVNKKIEECNNGIKILKDTVAVHIQNIEIVNSEAKDYSPLITADGSKMMFTSRRSNTTGGQIDPFDEQYFEDIFISEKKDGTWETPVNIGAPLNTANHDATVGLSNDGQTLISYNFGNLFISELKGDKWLKPKELPKTINSKEHESSACFSYDGKTLYFVRGLNIDPQKSNGDIYYSTKDKDGKWQEAQKLSPIINTPYDEEGVYMHPDGKTLYFSSKGHNSMGGYDLFKTELLENGKWTKPQNLGYPINSPDDDIYFVIAGNNKIAYYSAIRDDSKGFNDIYQIVFLNNDNNLLLDSEDNLIASNTNPTSETTIDKSTNLTIVKGIIIDENTGKPIDAVIQIIDNETNEVVYETTSNSNTGEYLVSLPPGKNYGIAIKKDGYLFHTENFDLVETEGGYTEVKQDVKMVNVEENSIVTLNNLFFDVGNAEISKNSYAELNTAIEFMNDNPDIKVEIQGHTDNVGGLEFNKKLSQDRANAVVNYMVEHGIDRNRLVPVGYWYKSPQGDNNSREGRAKNRRVELKIIEK